MVLRERSMFLERAMVWTSSKVSGGGECWEVWELELEACIRYC